MTLIYEVYGMKITHETWNKLAEKAWDCRENAIILGDTKVGAALLTDTSNIFTGCNIEHIFRCHDMHAEVNAITTMVAAGDKKVIAIIVTAERHKFTPCGGCMDWIFYFGGGECEVAYQNKKNGEIYKFTAQELMPHYPH